DATALMGGPHEVFGVVDGEILVPDYDDDCLWRISPTATTVVAGTGSSGITNGPLSVAQFDSPLDVGVDVEGAFYVADTGNNCIRRVSPTRVTSFAGGCGPFLAGYTEGAALSARFNSV